MEAKKCGYITVPQKRRLTEIMKGKDYLISGKFTKNFSREDTQKEWKNIANALNAVPGAKKEWRQWRKSWQDLWVKAKRKQAFVKRHASATAGGAKVDNEISSLEEDILSTITPIPIEESKESVVKVDLDCSSNEYSLPMERAGTSTNNDDDYTLKTEPPPESLRLILLEERKIEIKENYYKEKLALMRKNNEIQQNMCDTLHAMKFLLERKSM